MFYDCSRVKFDTISYFIRLKFSQVKYIDSEGRAGSDTESSEGGRG